MVEDRPAVGVLGVGIGSIFQEDFDGLEVVLMLVGLHSLQQCKCAVDGLLLVDSLPAGQQEIQRLGIREGAGLTQIEDVTPGEVVPSNLHDLFLVVFFCSGSVFLQQVYHLCGPVLGGYVQGCLLVLVLGLQDLFYARF